MYERQTSRTERSARYAGRETVAGLFHNRADAERAIDELRSAGFTRDDIGIALRDRDAQGRMAESTGSHEQEGLGAGAVGGTVLGGLAGFLVSIGALAIPGVGPVIAGGVLSSTLAGIVGGTAAGAGLGALTGGIVGALVGMGIPEDEAQHLNRGFNSGGTLVTVRAQARAEDVAAILDQNGADMGQGTSGTTQVSAPGYSSTETINTEMRSTLGSTETRTAVERTGGARSDVPSGYAQGEHSGRADDPAIGGTFDGGDRMSGSRGGNQV